MKMQLTKRKVAAVLAGVAVFSIVQLSAATLGGATSDTLQANTATVAKGAGATVSYDIKYDSGTGFAAGSTSSSTTGTGSFDVTAVKVTFASPAQYDSTATVTVVLTDASGNALATYTGPVSQAPSGLTPTDSSKLPSVEAVSNVAVAVEGKPVTASTAK